MLTCGVHEGSDPEDVADGVRRGPGPGDAHVSRRHRHPRRGAHLGGSRRHGVGVGVRINVVVREAGLRRGLLAAFVLAGLGQISNLVA